VATGSLLGADTTHNSVAARFVGGPNGFPRSSAEQLVYKLFDGGYALTTAIQAMIPNNKTNAPTALVMWVMWGAFASSLVMYRMMLVGKADNTHSIVAPDTIFAWLCYVIPIAMVLALRWLAIPRLRLPNLILPVFVVGIAFAEVQTFFGIFLFPAQFSLFYFTSWFLIVQMMPIWTLRTDQPNG
jgi:hypothetical protein